MKIKLSKSQWEHIGLRSGWIRVAKYGDQMKSLYLKQGINEDAIDTYIQKFDIIRKKKYKELFDDIPNVNIPPEQKK